MLPSLDADGTLDLNANDSIANRLRTGLQAAGANTRVGLDPEAFAIDKTLRPTPFPGLAVAIGMCVKSMAEWAEYEVDLVVSG